MARPRPEVDDNNLESFCGEIQTYQLHALATEGRNYISQKLQYQSEPIHVEPPVELYPVCDIDEALQ